MKPRVTVFYQASLLLLLLIVAGCAADDTRKTPAVQTPLSVTTTQAHRTQVPLVVTATGTIEAGTTVVVSTRMMGWVRTVHVKEGDLVDKGDLLVSIDDRDLQAARNKAQAGLTEARAVLANADKTATRFGNLYDEQAVSRQQLDDVLTGRDRAAAGVELATAGLAEVEVHLDYLDIVAPVAGLVTRRAAETGNMASPGQMLLTLETTGDMKVVAQVGEKDIAKVALGTPLSVTVTSLDNLRFSVPITKIVPAANRGSRTYNIEAALNTVDNRLLSGMFARVLVPLGERETILVPAEAVHRRGALTGVWEVDSQQTVHLRWVRLGSSHDNEVEVLAGLSGGETLVLNSSTPLREGLKVVD